MGQSLTTPLSLTLQHWKDVQDIAHNQSVEVRKKKWTTFCSSEWPSFNVGWPQDGTFNFDIIFQVKARVMDPGPPGHPDQVAYIVTWEALAYDPPPWVKPFVNPKRPLPPSAPALPPLPLPASAQPPTHSSGIPLTGENNALPTEGVHQPGGAFALEGSWLCGREEVSPDPETGGQWTPFGKVTLNCRKPQRSQRPSSVFSADVCLSSVCRVIVCAGIVSVSLLCLFSAVICSVVMGQGSSTPLSLMMDHFSDFKEITLDKAEQRRWPCCPVAAVGPPETLVDRIAPGPSSLVPLLVTEASAMMLAQGLVVFENVAIYFSQQEWGLLDEAQRLLYCHMMLQNIAFLSSVGLIV
ncbi:uncharacterized protein LOC129542871 [Moschus berezovskii]|uniref:uncharacterized protein LOC129542871 n=1 Tax=Moschus berezovskii TaxID=68408 RepID=UPI0024453189|nr:uncharacterized protein LOC129542871 [Moschus berezovskii]